MIEAAELRAEEAKQRDLQLWSLGRHKEVDYFLFFVFGLQMLVMLLMFLFVDFNFAGPSELALNRGDPLAAATPYKFYRDSALFLFAGYGFLNTFVKKYSFSGLAYGFLIAAFALEWSIVWLGLFQQWSRGSSEPFEKSHLSITHLQAAIYGATAVTISSGAVLGRVDPLQLAFMAVFETFFYALNLLIAYTVSEGIRSEPQWLLNNFAEVFGRLDPGGSMLVHLFAAVFAFFLSLFFRPAKSAPDAPADERDTQSDYHSNTYALFGTLLLFVFFPSFNAALALP